MAEAGTWKHGRRRVVSAPTAGRPTLAGPLRPGGRSIRGARTQVAGAFTLATAGLPYLAVVLAGVMAGLAVSGAVHALAGRTLFDVSAEAAGLFLVAAPLLGLLPLSWLLLLASARPALLERVPRLLVAWGLVAGCTTFWYGIRPFLR